jgi:hypothetical protein
MWWRDFVANFPELIDIHERMESTREDRVLALERAVLVFHNRPTAAPLTLHFILGYLTSRIGGGSLDHVNLLFNLWPSDPSPIVWYGLCAGLYPASDVQGFANGLGRRTLRDVLMSEPALDRPRCDIAIAELEILAGGDRPSLDFLTNSQSYLSVEIRPRVVAPMRWPVKPNSSTERQTSIDPRLPARLEDIMVRLQDVYSSVSGKPALFPGTQSQPSARKKRKYR